MNISKKIAYGITLCLAFSVFTGTSCSYVVDSIEGAITKRSSFSITVTPNGGSNYLVDWSDAGDVSGESFAGYEIYITEQPDNEFAGYRALAASYDLTGTGGITADPALALASTKSKTVTFSADSGSVYYFRVGVITWNESTEADRVKNWTSPIWGPATKEYYYMHKTTLDKISGGERVKF